MKLKKEFSKLFNFITLTIRDLPLISLFVLMHIVLAIIPSLQIIAVANFIDKSIAIYNNTEALKSIYLAIFLIAACLVGSFLLNEGISFTRLNIYNKYNIYIQNKILIKRSRLKYQLVEDDKTWNLIAVIEKDPAKNIIDGLSNSLYIISLIIKIIGFIAVISIHIWWTGIAVLFIAIPTLYQSYKSGKVEYEAFEKAEEIERRADYLQDVLSSRECADERKLFQYYIAVDNAWKEKYEEMKYITYNAFKKFFIQLGISNSLSKILVVIIGLILLLPLKQKHITVGVYMSLLASSISLFTSLTTELAIVLENFIKNNLFYDRFNDFMNLEEEIEEINKETIFNNDIGFSEIIFKNVSFTYPNSEKKILDNLNLVFKAGKRYALVGENGSGKTTIVKILIGLYDSYEGEITIDGIELRNLTKSLLKSLYQVVFQDFYRYELSIRDFLTLGFNECEKMNIDMNLFLNNALLEVDLYEKINSLKEGLNTKIGKINEKGIDLSGGQWQRLAIARTLVLNRAFTILDEPTAAIDPVSESKLYKLFSEITEYKSSLIITHRLGAARIADEILVLKDGKIAEKGNHESLINKKGIYEKMFSVQRSWYYEK